MGFTRVSLELLELIYVPELKCEGDLCVIATRGSIISRRQDVLDTRELCYDLLRLELIYATSRRLDIGKVFKVCMRIIFVLIGS